MELVRFHEAGRRPDRNSTLVVYPVERLVGPPGRSLEHVGASGAAAESARPHEELATLIGDELERSLLGDEPHRANVATAEQTEPFDNGLDNRRAGT